MLEINKAEHKEFRFINSLIFSLQLIWDSGP